MSSAEGLVWQPPETFQFDVTSTERKNLQSASVVHLNSKSQINCLKKFNLCDKPPSFPNAFKSDPDKKDDVVKKEMIFYLPVVADTVRCCDNPFPGDDYHRNPPPPPHHHHNHSFKFSPC